METKDADKQKRSKSMWRAYREKKAAKLHHASNYQTGFIDVNEHHLNRTGIRGRKRGCTWCCVAALLFVSLANLVLNLVLVTFLRLGPSGLPYMVFDTQSNIIFPQTTNLSALESSGVISSYYNRSLGLQSPVFDIHAGRMRVQKSTGRTLNSSQVNIDSSGIKMKPYRQFKLVQGVVDSSSLLTEDIMILNSSTAWFGPPLFSDRLYSDRIVTNSVKADQMTIEKKCNIKTKKAITLASSDSIMLSSLNENVQFTLKQQGHLVIKQSEEDGVLSLVLPRLPEFSTGTGGGMGTRLCICENGRVFRSMGDNCLIQTNEYSNPCKI